MKKDRRAKLIEKAIRGVYDSLESHLPHTHGKHNGGSKKHHKKCIRSYAKQLMVLTRLYD